jgi:hypothetical protein
MSTIQKVKSRAATTTKLAVSDDEIRIIDTELNELLSRIAAIPSFEEATSAMHELGAFQETLALLWFQYDIPISADQKIVVRKFDRSDDPDTCKHVFEEVRNGRFLIKK